MSLSEMSNDNTQNPNNLGGYYPFMSQTTRGSNSYTQQQNYEQHQGSYQMPTGLPFVYANTGGYQSVPMPAYPHLMTNHVAVPYSAVQPPQLSAIRVSNQAYAVAAQPPPPFSAPISDSGNTAKRTRRRPRGSTSKKVVHNNEKGDGECSPSSPEDTDQQKQIAKKSQDRRPKDAGSNLPNAKGCVAEATISSSRSRRRSTKGKLRRNTTVDGVLVEEPFTLSLPPENMNVIELLRLSNENQEGEDGEVGDGCYISCTVHGRRYYGVLIDQNALKAASTLYFKNEADSLDLNRRMMLLYNKRKQDSGNMGLAGNDKRSVARAGLVCDRDEERKRLRVGANDAFDKKQNNSEVSGGAHASDSTVYRLPSDPINSLDSALPPLGEAKQVQKFLYTPPELPNGSGPGYRTLFATYANVHAAAEDNVGKETLIFEACEVGGNFVGNYYYQYVVSER